MSKVNKLKDVGMKVNSNLIGMTIRSKVAPDPLKIKREEDINETDKAISEGLKPHHLDVLDAFTDRGAFYYLCKSHMNEEVYIIHPSWIEAVGW